MASKVRSIVTSRKPSLSRIKNTESQMLRWEGKVVFFGNKINEVKTYLKNLDKKKIRLNTSERIQLMKLKSLLKTRLTMAQRNAKAHGDRLKAYSSVRC